MGNPHESNVSIELRIYYWTMIIISSINQTIQEHSHYSPSTQASRYKYPNVSSLYVPIYVYINIDMQITIYGLQSFSYSDFILQLINLWHISITINCRPLCGIVIVFCSINTIALPMQ